MIAGTLLTLLPAVYGDEPHSTELGPVRSNAWMEEDGIRAVWFSYKSCTEEMVDAALAAGLNTVILKHGFHDLLDMTSLHWEGDELKGALREKTRDRILETTHRAANRGLHVFWIANYELDSMLPHLKRLGYHRAYVEGPTRFIPAGPHDDAGALDPVFWRGITGLHGEWVARLSLHHPIEGMLHDTEHYSGGIMYLQGNGYADISFLPFLEAQGIKAEPGQIPEGTRYSYLRERGLLPAFHRYLEEAAYEQGRYLATRCHAINPHLVFGIWPLFDNWWVRGYLRGLGGAVPAIGLSGVEYYHGAEQSRAMADLFESRIPNLRYLAGFYPPVAYSVEQLEYHVAQAIADTGGYWMLSPEKQLTQPAYQEALRAAYRLSEVSIEKDDSVALRCHAVDVDESPVLLVETPPEQEYTSATPELTVRSSLGGSALCERLPMTRDPSGAWSARIPLVRRLTNNPNLDAGFRAGVHYTWNPPILDYLYEDSNHTKLVDGMAYGYFSTTIAWPEDVEQAEVQIDLQRAYRLERVDIAQPFKLEDRVGGPTDLTLYVAHEPGAWGEPIGFYADPRMTPDTSDTPPEAPPEKNQLTRAWLAWKSEPIHARARYLRLTLAKKRPNGSISLGEVVVWGRFDGEVEASLYDGDTRRDLGSTARFVID